MTFRAYVNMVESFQLAVISAFRAEITLPSTSFLQIIYQNHFVKNLFTSSPRCAYLVNKSKISPIIKKKQKTRKRQDNFGIDRLIRVGKCEPIFQLRTGNVT